MEKMGVSETKEVMVAINELALALFKHFKDGVQVSDFAEIFAQITTDEKFKTIMLEAYVGFNKIPSEMKDIDVSEIVELSSLQLSYIPKVLDALKKPKEISDV